MYRGGGVCGEEGAKMVWHMWEGKKRARGKDKSVVIGFNLMQWVWKCCNSWLVSRHGSEPEDNCVIISYTEFMCETSMVSDSNNVIKGCFIYE